MSILSTRTIFVFLAMVSGASGAGYEVLYNRALTSVLGHTFSVNASILVSFLSGLSIGSLCAYRFRHYLWLMEIGLGLYTMVFFTLISITGSFGGVEFLYIFSTSHYLALAGASLLTFFPATLVGMATPIFSLYLKEHFTGHSFRIVYIVYNIGAIAGVLLTEFLLLRIMPMSKAAFFMGGLNFFVGFALLATRCKFDLFEYRVNWSKAFPPPLLLSLFILSISSSIFQLFFLKTVYYTIGRFNSNFSLYLASVFFYMAAGTLLLQYRPSLSRWVFPAAALSIAFWLAAQPIILYFVAILNSIEIKLSLPSNMTWMLAPIWLGFPLLFFGASVPACIKSKKAVSRDSGLLLFVSGLGNVSGYLLFTLVLHPHLNIRFVLFFGAFLAILSLIMLPEISKRNKLTAACSSLLFIIISIFTWNQGLYFMSLEGYRSYSILKKQDRLTREVEEFPSNDQTFALRHYFSPGEAITRKKYFMDGYVSLDLPSEESTAGSAAAMFSHQRNNLLVLGFGTGMSAGAASVFFKHVDLVELNPQVIRLQDRFSDINFNIHRLPKTSIFQGDGFQYLLNSEKKYDLIISTVTAPFYPASSKMYTDEFYHLITQRLTPGGIFSNWFDVRLHPDAVPIFLKTLKKHFSSCAMNYIYDSYYILVCSNKPLKANLDLFTQGEVSLEKYEEVVGKGIKKRLKNRALISDVLEPRFLEALGVKADTPINSIDWPHLEYFHPEKARNYHFSFMKGLLPLIDFGFSVVDGRPMTKEEFDGRCQSIKEWFEDAEPECRKQFHEKFGGAR